MPRCSRGIFRSFAERQAVNAPLQGSNADLIKKAMIEAHIFLKGKYDTRLLLQVHDELIFEVPLSEMEIVEKAVKKIMESVEILKVPLTVGVGQGTTWEDAH